MTWRDELCHLMDLTNQVIRFSFGRPLSMLTLLRQRAGRRKDGSEVLLSHKKVLWSAFMLTIQFCVSINPRSGVIMMNGMMLLFLDLTPDTVPLAVEHEDGYEPDIAEYAEAFFGEQTHWFCQTGKCDVVEPFSSNAGLRWHMSRLNMKVGEPIDHKHGWSFNSETKQYQGWKQLEKLDPEFVLITNPSPNSWKYSLTSSALMWWNGSLIEEKVSLWSHHLIQDLLSFCLGRHQNDRIKYHIGCLHIDMTNCCRCDPSIKDMRVYYNCEDDLTWWNLSMPSLENGSFGQIHIWKILPSRLCSFIAHFTHLVPWKDMRQNFLFEDLLGHDDDDGALCGASVFLDSDA